MLKPSYAELMDVMNKENGADVTSRYSVVIAAAKRARQLIDGDEPMTDHPTEGKPVTTAVTEINEGKVAIVPEGQGTKIKIKKKEKMELEEEIQQAKPNGGLEKDDEVLAEDAASEEKAEADDEAEAADEAADEENIAEDTAENNNEE